MAENPGTVHADVVVVGGGNAGFTAAHAAAERGRSVILLEKGTEELSGGNSFYTAGATRIVHDGLEDLAGLIEPDDRHASTVVPPYTAENYASDLAKVTEGRNDPGLTEVLIAESQSTLRWLNSLGLKYRLMYERQAYERPDGSYLFWGGLHVGNVGGGEGMMADHTRVAREHGVDIRYGSPATRLLLDGGRVTGVVVSGPEGDYEIAAESVVLTAGGFESSPELRREHLGEGWENAKVRGTPCNTGDMILAALDAGAARGGDWNTCHSVQWDAFTENNESNRELTNRLTRQSYPLGIIVNRDGERFLDEGADFRNYTYAKYGREILRQPGSVAWQIFDATLRPMLRTEEYDMPGVSVETADSIAELAAKVGIDPEALEKTVTSFNASVDRDVEFDPNVLDGRSAQTEPVKSNWAVPLETGPFYAYGVTCGITFTFGGVKGDTHGRVLDAGGNHIPGLYAAGEMLGGLFSTNYPGGSGLAAGCVFGRRAGALA
ncbi:MULTISPECIES: FAD-dependent tricarballylate dehydrogenase TcuA [unclassified Arthrobacter]|uniref:FAD-dependent tricarballylate dehydrogenase TcuA n=1 Tax=unclassified Arthrobacter TaxID=235627 RepID=UPI001E5D99ED|nr:MULTISPECIES: FAD-dependent tricarballylate dehydrogenase TcuA [unclassified Arthrobacter]MCC9145979.1 FAD-dependent tricarballylate dehydrogenase TcuA [Arthrobacter sp. zg-Y919]MDK1277208.1 FAD-dependent tricarballylate dehydrogenase TcuA [Arthrobacter sp. zg.Y919]WIB03722.1 FAD-dependent tricarballylate dehydrogenase TcuA [Arthrobacter sp. zg-Y919]